MGMGAFAETFARQAGVVDAMEKDLLTARISQALHPYGKGNVFVRTSLLKPLESRKTRTSTTLLQVTFLLAISWFMTENTARQGRS